MERGFVLTTCALSPKHTKAERGSYQAQGMQPKMTHSATLRADFSFLVAKLAIAFLLGSVSVILTAKIAYTCFPKSHN
eukprot:6486271-Amphidinium_carterae.1